MPEDPRKASRDLYWRDRDGSQYQCPGCGRPREVVDAIEVHHRDQNKRNPDPNNTIGLCRSCHQDGEHDNRRATVSPRLHHPTPQDTDPPSPSVSKLGF